MKRSNKTKWLKVIELAVVGCATWLVPYTEISDFCVNAPDATVYSCQRSRRSEQHQVLLFLLKLCFQVLTALQQERDRSTQVLTPAQRVFWLKLCFQILAALQQEDR
jgi:uncharacterized membrane protein